MSFIEFLHTDMGIKDWIALVFLSLTIALFVTIIICKEIKLIKYFLFCLLLAFTLCLASYRYHEINYDLYKAEQCILEKDYYSAIYIYKKLLTEYPELPRVVEAYNKCIEEIPDPEWLDIKENFRL